MQFAITQLCERGEIGPEPDHVVLRFECDEGVLHAVVVALDRQARALDAERGEQRLRVGVRLDARQRLLHAAEDDAPGVVPLELDRHEAAFGLELDYSALE